MTALLISVRLHDGRYHGQPEWPPSPMRLFQALVAGAGRMSGVKGDAERALEWLERLGPPIVCAPRSSQAKATVVLYVQNNDSDRVKEALTGKREAHGKKEFRPYLFDASVPFLYAWAFDGKSEGDKGHAEKILGVAERLYQLGRGIDMAWAWGEIVEDGKLDALLHEYPGQVFRPSKTGGRTALRCPCEGSLRSLEDRHRAKRFEWDRKIVTYSMPPIPRFQVVAYESPPSRKVFELRRLAPEGEKIPWRLDRAGLLVTLLRDAAVKRLKDRLPSQASEIDRVLVGRKPDGTNSGPTADRVRIIPLASIGHPHADMGIRRVLVEVPPTCPLQAEDVHWAFSGLELDCEGDGKAVLTKADDIEFASHYGVGTGESYRVWRTVTPAALLWRVAHPDGHCGPQRLSHEQRVVAALAQALRHAGVRVQVEEARVQREPFHIHGAMAGDFSPHTRFSPDRLWHAEITFKEGMVGPLVVGDGRFLGLGVMAPRDMRP